VELNWSTFVLEIINFLVLVWILKRFLYKPVLEVIARRQAGIENTRSEAQALRAHAEKLEEQYEGRLADWEQERQQALKALAGELEIERGRKIEEIHEELEKERERARVAEASRQASALARVEETALKQAAGFAAQLLDRVAGPDTEARLVESVITSLSQLPAERINAIRNSRDHALEHITVASAYPLSEDQQRRLEQALVALLALNIPLRFEQDADLLAGVRIEAGAWLLGCNLRDELRGLAELAHVG
jgi:F-type H+-transporting ATPase subunit b